MANVVTTQIILDGDRNVVMLLVGKLDASNEVAVIKVDVSALVPACTSIRVDRIVYQITPTLSVFLDWDATARVSFAYLTGSGEACYKGFGGLQNNAGAGKTGDIWLGTTGYGSGVATYTILLEMTKQGVIG